MEELFEQPIMDETRIIKSDVIDNPMKFVILNVSELDKIDFNDVFNDQDEFLRYSLDGTKTFLKFRGETPECILNLKTKSQIYTMEEINEILHNEEWNNQL
jgi:hypothetical protein